MAQKIQYCTCKVNLAGQNCHVVYFSQFDAVTWPEVQVLQALHGDENVMDIMPCGIGEVWPTEEKNRLTAKYGHKVVEACFPGRAFRMEYMMTDDVSLPHYEEGKPSTVVALPSNGDDEDDGDDEVAKAQADLTPIFKPRGRRTPPPPDSGAA